MARRISIKPLDKLFSQMIRTRDKWSCQRCGRKYEPPTMGLHAAHCLGRRPHSTRWLETNAMAMCYGCHSYMDTHQIEKEQLFEEKFGEGIVNKMRQLHGTKVNTEKTKEELKEKLEYYQSKLNEL